MSSALLYYGYLGVMSFAMVCFVQAFRTRRHTPTHKRWGMAGACVSLGGIAVVMLGAYVGSWVVPARLPEVVLWHRRLAFVATGLIIALALTGALRWRIHKKLYLVFLPLYAIVLLLAIVGYRP